MNIYRLIDWLMMLPEDLTKRFTEDLIKYEEVWLDDAFDHHTAAIVRIDAHNLSL